mmetsp:Transcript_5955/g.19821  ORF Transcript_5955/g.19821 Transcript_5955/m.19821 type:complete len:355 (-) Transcript_5955:1143-2207(-)
MTPVSAVGGATTLNRVCSPLVQSRPLKDVSTTPTPGARAGATQAVAAAVAEEAATTTLPKRHAAPGSARRVTVSAESDESHEKAAKESSPGTTTATAAPPPPTGDANQVAGFVVGPLVAPSARVANGSGRDKIVVSPKTKRNECPVPGAAAGASNAASAEEAEWSADAAWTALLVGTLCSLAPAPPCAMDAAMPARSTPSPERRLTPTTHTNPPPPETVSLGAMDNGSGVATARTCAKGTCACFVGFASARATNPPRAPGGTRIDLRKPPPELERVVSREVVPNTTRVWSVTAVPTLRSAVETQNSTSPPRLVVTAARISAGETGDDETLRNTAPSAPGRPNARPGEAATRVDV